MNTYNVSQFCVMSQDVAQICFIIFLMEDYGFR